MGTEDGEWDVEERVLSQLLRLISGWSAPGAQRMVARGVGVELDDSAIRAVYLLGLHGGSARPSDLAEELHLSRPTASKLLSRLSGEGLIDLSEHPDDRRAKLVSLSASGRDACRRLHASGVAMVAGGLEDWTREDRARFDVLLGRFVSALIGAPPLMAVGGVSSSVAESDRS